jgi:hypothetical protein
MEKKINNYDCVYFPPSGRNRRGGGGGGVEKNNTLNQTETTQMNVLFDCGKKY